MPCQNYENALPAKAGSTFSQHDFYQRRVHDEVSVPKMASKLSLWGGRFGLVLLLKPCVLPTERKRAPPGKLCLASLASRMHFGWDFHIFALDLVIICETRFPSSCRASQLSRNKYLMMIASSNRRLSKACSSSHIRIHSRRSQIEGRRCALPRGPSIT